MKVVIFMWLIPRCNPAVLSFSVGVDSFVLFVPPTCISDSDRSGVSKSGNSPFSFYLATSCLSDSSLGWKKITLPIDSGYVSIVCWDAGIASTQLPVVVRGHHPSTFMHLVTCPRFRWVVKLTRIKKVRLPQPWCWVRLVSLSLGWYWGKYGPNHFTVNFLRVFLSWGAAPDHILSRCSAEMLRSVTFRSMMHTALTTWGQYKERGPAQRGALVPSLILIVTSTTVHDGHLMKHGSMTCLSWPWPRSRCSYRILTSSCEFSVTPSNLIVQDVDLRHVAAAPSLPRCPVFCKSSQSSSYKLLTTAGPWLHSLTGFFRATALSPRFSGVIALLSPPDPDGFSALGLRPWGVAGLVQGMWAMPAHFAGCYSGKASRSVEAVKKGDPQSSGKVFYVVKPIIQRHPESAPTTPATTTPLSRRKRATPPAAKPSPNRRRIAPGTHVKVTSSSRSSLRAPAIIHHPRSKLLHCDAVPSAV